MLLFALAALVVSGVLVGVAPAIRLARTDVRSLMNESTRSASGGRGTGRWLSVMTVAEIALAIMLVAGAGWLVRGFSSLRNTDAGFVADQRVIFDVSFQGQKYRDQNAVRTAATDLLTSLGAIAGVARVGAASAYPMRGTLESSLILQFHGEAMDPSNPRGTRQRFVTPGSFAAMGTRVLQGRDFGPEDTPTGQRTAIINRTFATKYLAGRDPIGVQFSAGYPAPNPANEVTVVGVIEDVRQKSLGEVAEPAFYQPHAQMPLRRMTMVVSASRADVGAIETSIRQEVRKQDPLIAVDFEQAATSSDPRFGGSSSG